MKKILSIALSLAMVFCLSAAAFASGGPGGGGGASGGPGGPGGPGGSSREPESYDAAYEYSGDAAESGRTYESTGTNENVIHVTDGEVVISDAVITRDSQDSTGGDQASFYGVGAAVLTTGGTVVVKDSRIATDAAGGAGVFAYGDGTAYVADTTIATQKSASGGVHVAGGGTLYAWDLEISTNGGSAAAIRSDRGSGTMVVDGGSYISNGLGSPAIYSTADISVHNAALAATGSEAICIEGFNSIRLYDCDLSGAMPDQEQNDCTWNVIVYQSMSGDSKLGCGTFQMVGGTLTAANGGMFYTTNTESVFLLDSVDITMAEDAEFFLKCTGNLNRRGWGSSGANGADCNFTAVDQVMEGDVIWDSISGLDFYLLGKSTLTGAFVNDESAAGSGGSGYASLYISAGSAWIVTADSVLTNLYNEGSVTDENGKAVTIRSADGTVLVEGESAVTVTVERCETAADFSGAAVETAWEEHAVEKPDSLS